MAMDRRGAPQPHAQKNDEAAEHHARPLFPPPRVIANHILFSAHSRRSSLVSNLQQSQAGGLTSGASAKWTDVVGTPLIVLFGVRGVTITSVHHPRSASIPSPDRPKLSSFRCASGSRKR